MTPRLSALRGVSLMIAVCKKEVKNQIVWPPANSMHLLFKTLPPIRNVDYVSAISLIVLRDNGLYISDNIHGHRIFDEVIEVDVDISGEVRRKVRAQQEKIHSVFPIRDCVIFWLGTVPYKSLVKCPKNVVLVLISCPL